MSSHRLFDARDDDPFAPFEAWARARQRATKGRLAAGSARVYRSMWRGWIAFLAERGMPWSEAEPRDVERFVAQLQARSGRMTAASSVTERRYWRVVRDVYAHACKGRWIAFNPASHVDRDEIPRSERKDAMVIAPAFLAALRRRIPPADGDWRRMRDRALIALLCDAGLTVGELVALNLDQVIGQGEGPWVLRIEGARPAQKRDVPIGQKAGRALQAWLRRREALETSNVAVFVQQKGLLPLSTPTVYSIVRTWLSVHLPALGLEQMQHQGPGALRTAVINAWLHRGVPEEEVLRLAGLDEPQALRRLQHAADDVRRGHGRGGLSERASARAAQAGRR